MPKVFGRISLKLASKNCLTWVLIASLKLGPAHEEPLKNRRKKKTMGSMYWRMFGNEWENFFLISEKFFLIFKAD